jgi:tetratricopeptide (TPR) repeat protein
MKSDRVSEPPDPETATSLAKLTEHLLALRMWAGKPSLRRLRELGGGRVTATGGHRIDSLPESTTSYVLRGDRPASAEFVRNFVAACMRVRDCDQEEIAKQVDRWHRAWVAAASDATPADNDLPAGPPLTALIPRQLPAEAAGFTGRGAELSALNRSVASEGATSVLIVGAAGVGKTTLAVRAAHRLAAHYPDGQLFIDLHGFTATLDPVDATAALDRLLRALGVPGERIPVHLDDRAALWRSLLAGRRMLIVLDNAATDNQVTPLLPGTERCLALVTSRRRLGGLPATGTVMLDELPEPDAVRLFVQTANRSEFRSDERQLLAEAVQLCGRLPLAIRVAAARLRFHRSWSLADLVGRLRDQDRRLAELSHAGSGVAPALEVSYRHLSAPQQHAYQRLGCHPGHDFDAYGAAALVGRSVEETTGLVDELLDVHLLQEPAPGRYAFHDLVRAHAADVAITRSKWRRSPRRAAVTRLLDYYRRATAQAMDTAYPYEHTRRPRVPAPRSPVPSFDGLAQATRWLDEELPNLLESAQHAAATRWPVHATHIAALLYRHLRTRGRHRDAEQLHQQALTAARAAGDRRSEVAALIGLGWAQLMLGSQSRATEYFQHGRELAEATKNRTGELDTLIGLARIDLHAGRREQALAHYRLAREIAEATGDRTGELAALRGFGHLNLTGGRYEQALVDYGRALEIAQATANPTGKLNAFAALGEVYRLLGRYQQAQDAYQRCLEISRSVGEPDGELSALIGLGHIDRLTGRHGDALERCAQALQIARATGDRTGELPALLGLAWIHRLAGRYEQALDKFQQIFDAARDAGDRNWQFEALHGLGRVHHGIGDQPAAIANHQRALDLAFELGQLADAARAHDGLARAHRAAGQDASARRHWQQALDILTDLGTEHSEEEESSAAAIRANLAALGEY